MKNSVEYYSVGALLYCPANRTTIAKSIIDEEFGQKFSLALCLEDTIKDDKVSEAETLMIQSLHTIYEEHQKKDFYLPKIFIRVRWPEQIKRLTAQMGNAIEIIAGYIAPKFSTENADQYITNLLETNEACGKKLYIMPILENPAMIHLQTRYQFLYEIKDKLDKIEELVLNVRVGGNDLCHMFGLRRHINENIHDMDPIANIFSDIMTVFGMNYVVSGPVWEYYNGEGWDKGLQNEIARDLLCGFVGKTVIHPNQIKVLNETLQIPTSDYEDAKSILNWDQESNRLVSGSVSKSRMNEYKTHHNWALKTLLLAEYYGTKYKY